MASTGGLAWHAHRHGSRGPRPPGRCPRGRGSANCVWCRKRHWIAPQWTTWYAQPWDLKNERRKKEENVAAPPSLNSLHGKCAAIEESREANTTGANNNGNLARTTRPRQPVFCGEKVTPSTPILRKRRRAEPPRATHPFAPQPPNTSKRGYSEAQQCSNVGGKLATFIITRKTQSRSAQQRETILSGVFQVRSKVEEDKRGGERM